MARQQYVTSLTCGMTKSLVVTDRRPMTTCWRSNGHAHFGYVPWRHVMKTAVNCSRDSKMNPFSHSRPTNEVPDAGYNYWQTPFRPKTSRLRCGLFDGAGKKLEIVWFAQQCTDFSSPDHSTLSSPWPISSVLSTKHFNNALDRWTCCLYVTFSPVRGLLSLH